MEWPLAAVVNVADINTKLTKAGGSFLMYLIGLVEYNNVSTGYVPAGEDEFNIYMQKKYMGQSIYENRSTSRSEHSGQWHGLNPESDPNLWSKP